MLMIEYPLVHILASQNTTINQLYLLMYLFALFNNSFGQFSQFFICDSISNNIFELTYGIIHGYI